MTEAKVNETSPAPPPSFSPLGNQYFPIWQHPTFQDVFFDGLDKSTSPLTRPAFPPSLPRSLELVCQSVSELGLRYSE